MPLVPFESYTSDLSHTTTSETYTTNKTTEKGSLCYSSPHTQRNNTTFLLQEKVLKSKKLSLLRKQVIQQWLPVNHIQHTFKNIKNDEQL